MDTAEKRELRLHSPCGGDPILYEWPLVKTKQYDAAGEILDSIRFFGDEFTELELVMRKCVGIDKIDIRCYESMKSLCDNFSRAADTIRKMWKGATRPDRPNQAHASVKLLQHVVQQVYNRAVADPEKLNHHYEAFSSETYGETSFDMVQKMIEEIRPEKKDVFVDLGSGVGQVVIHVAGGSLCKKSVGIEKASVPARYAKKMQQEFSRWMKWYGKMHRNFELKKGDFLDPAFRDLITQEATIIFVNNFAFEPLLNHQLTKIFEELRDGVRIVSSKSFCSANPRLSDRRMRDIGAMMDVQELTPVPSSVSWTCTNVTYFLHTVNRTKLERYFFAQKNPRSKEDNGSRHSSKSSSRESSRSREVALKFASSVDDDEKNIYGPTTRRQWAEWVSRASTQIQQKKKKQMRPQKENEMELISWSPGSSQSSSEGEKKKKRKKAELGRTKPGPGRPRKAVTDLRLKAKQRSAKKQQTMASLELLHQHTLHSTIAQPPVPDVPHISAYRPKDLASPPLHPSRYPALELLLARMRADFEAVLDYMKTSEFKMSLVEAIAQEKMRNQSLKQRWEYLKRQVDNLLEDGVLKLKQRMAELNIQAHTPAELLNQSKEIVMRHQELQKHHSSLNVEVQKLEIHNSSLGFPDRVTVDAAKENILRDISVHYQRHKALITEMTRIQNQVLTLQSNLVQSSPGIQQIMEGLPSPLPTAVAPPTTAAAPKTAPPPSTTSTAGRGKRGRGSRSGGPPRKRQANGGATDKDSEKKNQDEIERQIQDIVQKALSVDCAAKSAEKERKQRSADRKRRGGGRGAMAASVPPAPIVSSSTTTGPPSTQRHVVTFSSPGLVPVLPPKTEPGLEELVMESAVLMSAAESEEQQNSRSSEETESAPPSDQEEAALSFADLAESLMQRPNSVPVLQHGAMFRIENLVAPSPLPRAHSAHPSVVSASQLP